jgi:hypothetical protein
MQHNGDQRRFETAEYWRVRSLDTRSRAEKMITPEVGVIRVATMR